MQIQAALLGNGDVIVERGPKGVRKALVARRRFDNLGCRGVHVDIRGGGSWCYDANAMVEVD